MARNVSIAITARDNFSTAITKMRENNLRFSNDLTGLQAKLNDINKNRTTLKLETKEAKKNLEAIQKEYEAAKKSGNGMVPPELIQRLEEANEEYENMRRNLSLLDRSARDAENAMARLGGARGRLDNRVGGGSGGGGAGGDDFSGMMKTLAAAGATKAFGDLASQVAGAFIGSAYGDEGSTIFASLLSGIGSGAAMGTMIGGPGSGTAIGAGAGAVMGGISAATQIFSKEDDAFKQVVQDQYNALTQKWQEDLTAGTSIAAGRQTDMIAFTKLLKGEDTARDYLSWVKDTANSTPFLYDDLKAMSKTLATYRYTPEEMQDTLLKIGDTGAALGMSTQDMSMVATALGRMRSSGKTSLEYLNLLVERGIPAIDYLATAMSDVDAGIVVTNADIYDMVSKGLIPGAEAARALADAMGADNAGAMEAMAETYSGLMSTKEGLEQELQNAMGEGYTLGRNPAIAEQVAYLGGEAGEQMQEAYRMMGQYQASLENAKEKAWRDAITGAMESTEYLEAAAANDGARMGEILTQAEEEALAAYHDTEQYEQYETSQKSIVNRLQSVLKDDWQHFGYEMGLEFTKGLSAAAGRENVERALGITERFESGTQTIEDLKKWYPHMSDEEIQVTYNAQTLSNSAYEELPGYAYGLPYVPYDDYPARLHEGERVLTASEARAYKGGGGGITIPKLADTIVVREDADIDRIASEIARKLREVQMLM